MIIRAAGGKFKGETIRLKLEGTMLLEEPLEMSEEDLLKIIKDSIQPEVIMDGLEVTSINKTDIGVSVEVLVDLNSPVCLDADILGKTTRRNNFVSANRR